ncbi:hypothetical protein [Bacillus sp. S/N-304-OC-R1]|uniref:hypothetical protein n=1 Tax=Bacillus sp. S/N-304-OC-R1 TaxID=2758034 RepID=UPI001C8EF37D|nr:hypothetical protein [Bacillus sp. S/N-304-OC-R1]MBY0123444.1 hypothetical protein [Bacillus sp. S/N-304-OC-R1]
MEALVKFIKKTKQLLTHLENDLPVNGREEYIETTLKLLDEREQILKQLPDLKALDQDSKAELAKLEGRMQTLISNHQNVIKKDIQLLHKQKKNTHQYADPYGNISIDGMFLDKKK